MLGIRDVINIYKEMAFDGYTFNTPEEQENLFNSIVTAWQWSKERRSKHEQ
ncbi:MAG: hypothetical protein LKE41_01065 [Prevotella sp.]|jgi:hypothetical protein|nr:hypothetical protein [Prevotella sp.]